MIVLDVQDRIADLNPAAQGIIGVPAEQAIGQPVPKLLSTWQDMADKYPTLTGAKPKLIVERDGRQYHYDLRVSSLTDRHERRTGRLIVLRDITDQEQAEAARRDSERKFADIIGFLPDAAFVIDQKGKVIAWNHAMEEMTGIPTIAMMDQRNHKYAEPFYGERRPILIDWVLEPWEEVEKKHPNVTRQGKALVDEMYVPHLKEGGTSSGNCCRAVRC